MKKRIGLIMAAVLLFSLVAPLITSAQLADTPWPMFRHDLNHTGLSPYIGSPDGVERWNFSTNVTVWSSPAIGADGTIYVGSFDSKLYAIYPNGSERWNFSTGAEVDSSPAIGADGTIYVGSDDHKLYAIYPNGTERWNFSTNDIVDSSPAIGADGTIYVGSDDHKIYAIYPNGTERWNFSTDDDVSDSSPVIGADGTIYVGSQDNKLYTIYPNGTERWNFSTGSFVGSSPAIGADGTIYVGSYDSKLYAIYPNGTERWNFPSGSYIWESPAIGADGTIYVGSEDNKLYAIYPNGTERWNFSTGGGVGSPAIGADGTIYVGSEDNKLYAIGLEPAIAVEKTVWNGIAWVKELNASIGDTLTFNCTITNTGNVILTKIRFRDILDCSLVCVGDEYKFKPNVLHPDNCSWNLSNPLAYIFTVLCPENTYNPFDPDDWDDTNGDGNVSASDQIYFEGYSWYHVDRVPYTLNLSNATYGTKYFDSALNWDDPGMDLSNPLNSTWYEVCCCKDRYTLIDWECKNCPVSGISPGDNVTLQNERTLEVVQYTVEEVAKDLVVSQEYEFDIAGTGLAPGQVINDPTYQAIVVRCGVDNNTFVAKGKGRGDNYWTYSDPAVVTITVPCPSGDAADSTPAIKDVFTTGEDVYALGRNFAPLINVSIYITPVRTWAFGDNISDFAIIGPINTTTDANGSIGIYPATVLVWPDSELGLYHMVFDNQDGIYEPGVDLHDYFEVIGVAAVAAVPLITPLGLVALVGLLAAVAAVAIVRKRR